MKSFSNFPKDYAGQIGLDTLFGSYTFSIQDYEVFTLA